jgi:hypothetical protein
MILDGVRGTGTPTKYLVQTPAGDICKFGGWDHVNSLAPVDIPPDCMCPSDGMDEEGGQDPCLELNTVDIEIYKVDLHGQRLELLKDLLDYALFLGSNASM